MENCMELSQDRCLWYETDSQPAAKIETHQLFSDAIQ